jgi:phosphoadenosine phosphosulfate reductase
MESVMRRLLESVPETRAIAGAQTSTARLNARYAQAPADEILRLALDALPGQIALVSSFGADSAVLLHLLSQIDRDVPVLMLETQMLFAETLQYQRDLSTHLGLRDVRLLTPDPDLPEDLHLSDSKLCCALRKVAPLERALSDFAGTITGRKRFQTGARAQMPIFEADHAGRLRINPMASWTPAMLVQHIERHDLPRHPLVARGYPSIGCAPCTQPASAADPRAGRWANETREECGIHFAPDGRVMRRKAG